MKEKSTSNLFKNSLFSFLLNVSGTAISFFAIPITLKIMGIEQYGSFVLVQSVAMIVFTLLTVQYWQGLLLEFPGKEGRIAVLKRQVLRSAVYEGVGVAAALLAVASLPWFGIRQIGAFNIMEIVLIAVAVLVPALGSMIAFYRLTNQYPILMGAGLCSNGLRLALLCLSLAFHPTPAAVILSYAIPEILHLLFLVTVMLMSKKDLEATPDGTEAPDDKKIFSAGKWASFLAIADLPVANVDKVLVAVALSPEALGIYNIFKRLYSIIGMATAPVYMNSIPEFSRKINLGDTAGAFALWRKTIMLLLPLSLLVGAACYLLRGIWIPMIYRGLAAYGAELMVVIASAVVAGSFITTHAIYWALGKKKQTTAIAVGSNLFYLAMLLSLSHWLGLIGAVGAFLIHVTLVVAIKVVFLLKEKGKLA
ncbi:lipopolysaccharide biosynthesis protein [Janthinobacterium agaricidamnosum]|uniref:Polysaccharide biosynthesis family protein n=1 Tax=Janthinobacterium agaricidamnosum NBRC 102515 = DSM 9628 TaxID=1349767 RepID=W0V9N5_9BURK|nr:oligosaccharide flippase family protein [Janthinobacterium agaricidamnosum]CDG84606.1 polysaccharide biosynthesis family protein [Janthinobacterium agaricidamnosum NBRC 102515 = DSM 9628]